jgi:hypothetical protein
VSIQFYLRTHTIYVTSIYAILRPVYLFGTLYLFGSSWSSGVWLDRDNIDQKGFMISVTHELQSALFRPWFRSVS